MLVETQMCDVFMCNFTNHYLFQSAGPGLGLWIQRNSEEDEVKMISSNVYVLKVRNESDSKRNLWHSQLKISKNLVSPSVLHQSTTGRVRGFLSRNYSRPILPTAAHMATCFVNQKTL